MKKFLTKAEYENLISKMLNDLPYLDIKPFLIDFIRENELNHTFSGNLIYTFQQHLIKHNFLKTRDKDFLGILSGSLNLSALEVPLDKLNNFKEVIYFLSNIIEHLHQVRNEKWDKENEISNLGFIKRDDLVSDNDINELILQKEKFKKAKDELNSEEFTGKEKVAFKRYFPEKDYESFYKSSINEYKEAIEIIDNKLNSIALARKKPKPAKKETDKKLSFKCSLTNEQLALIYEGLHKEDFINPDMTVETFTKIFKSKDLKNENNLKFLWNESIRLLAYFFEAFPNKTITRNYQATVGHLNTFYSKDKADPISSGDLSSAKTGYMKESNPRRSDIIDNIFNNLSQKETKSN